MESEKTCPKCANFPRMDKMDGMKTVIPAIAGDQKDLITSGTIAVPVEVYRCPQCPLVKLYEVNNKQLWERDANKIIGRDNLARQPRQRWLRKHFFLEAQYNAPVDLPLF